MKSKNIIINLAVYDYDLMVSAGETDEVLKKKLSKLNVCSEKGFEICEYSSETNLGRAIMFAEGQCLIRIRKIPRTPSEYGILQHEILHIVIFVMSRIGMPLTEESTEAYTYLTQFLTKNIYYKLYAK